MGIAIGIAAVQEKAVDLHAMRCMERGLYKVNSLAGLGRFGREALAGEGDKGED